LDRLRALARRIATTDHWDRLALRRMTDDLYSAQRMMSAAALAETGSRGAEAVAHWREVRRDDLDRMLNFLTELERAGDETLAKLSLANSQIQKLAAPTARPTP
jgi:glutamate dehydrogenase